MSTTPRCTICRDTGVAGGFGIGYDCTHCGVAEIRARLGILLDQRIFSPVDAMWTGYKTAQQDACAALALVRSEVDALSDPKETLYTEGMRQALEMIETKIAAPAEHPEVERLRTALEQAQGRIGLLISEKAAAEARAAQLADLHVVQSAAEAAAPAVPVVTVNSERFRQLLYFQSRASSDENVDRTVAALVDHIDAHTVAAVARALKQERSEHDGAIRIITNRMLKAEAHASAQVAATGELRNKLMFAAIDCGHAIGSNEITLYRDDTKHGNALHQLAERLIDAAYGHQQGAEPATTWKCANCGAVSADACIAAGCAACEHDDAAPQQHAQATDRSRSNGNDDSRVSGNAQAAEIAGREKAQESCVSPLGKGDSAGREDAQAALSDEQIRIDLMRAATNCGHTIESEKITLQRDTRRPGNALAQLADRLLEAHQAAIDSRQPAPAVPWSFCPECGSEEIHHEEGEHKQCAACHQEWFSSIDYTDVVRKHLGEWKAAPVAAAVQGVDLSKLQLYRRSLDCMVETDAHDDTGRALYFNASDVQQLIAAQPPADAAPVDAKDELVRSGLSLMVELKKVKDEHAKILKDVYSALLWMHRRLPLAIKPFAGLYATIESVGRTIGHDAREELAEKAAQVDALSQEASDYPPLPETRYNGCGDGSEPLYTPEMMRDFYQQGRAFGIEEAITVVKNVPTMAGGSAQQNACIAAVRALNKGG